MFKPFPSRRRGAFTLVEMLVSLSIISVVMLALGSVIVLAGRALTTATTGSSAEAALARSAVDMIMADLAVALTITEQTSTAITFTVPARGSDLTPETIRYSWDGVAGHALMRQYNSSLAVSIADNVTTLNFQYLTRTAGP